VKSSILKRSVVLNGHKTSISLENGFWNAVRDIAKERHQRIGELLGSIDTQRRHSNLSSAVRLFVLDHYQQQFEAPKPINTHQAHRPARLRSDHRL
jgi:predicted DNA-binding ribbon-helix-helix protein